MVQYPIKGCRTQVLQDSRRGILGPNHGYHMKSLLILFQHFRDKLRRMLQIRIHKNQKAPTRIIQSGCHCGFMTKISGEMNDFDELRILQGQPVQNQGTSVRRSVIHKENLRMIFFYYFFTSEILLAPCTTCT